MSIFELGGQFLSTPLPVFPRAREHETAENRYWKKLKTASVRKLPAPVSSISFCRGIQDKFAVTSSTRVYIYNCKTLAVEKTISRFQGVAYSGDIRNDGKLLAAGGESPSVKVFDLGSRSILRQLSGHKGAIRKTSWSDDKIHILSCSDDKTARYWDISSPSSVAVFSGHEDYVRCCASGLASLDTWVTGSYDHTVRLWDVRVDNSSSSIPKDSSLLAMDHGAPVEAVEVMSGGGVVLTAGGNVIKVWDILSGGRLLHSFAQHQKTVTALSLDSTSSRILSGSLDGHVKIYDGRTFEPTHGFKFNSPVLSLGIAGANAALVVGTSDGQLHIRSRIDKAMTTLSSGISTSSDTLRSGSYKYALRGQAPAGTTGIDYFVEESTRKARLRPFDVALKRFRYGEALDTALASQEPSAVCGLIEELGFRQGLRIALSGRDEVSLRPLLEFLINYISSPRYSSLLADAALEVLELYAPVVGQSFEIDLLLVKLKKRVSAEVSLQRSVFGLAGVLDAVMSTASGAVTSVE